jgi:hypothetical protein
MSTPCITTIERRGIEQGRVAHAHSTLRRLLVQRFGTLPEVIEQRLNTAGADELDIWLDQVINAPSLAAIFGPERAQ